MPHLGGRHTTRDPDPVDPVRLVMEPVIGQFIDYIEKYEYTACQSDGQPENIDERISPVSPEISEGNYNVTPEHNVSLSNMTLECVKIIQ
jgi:hypothetical protein